MDSVPGPSSQQQHLKPPSSASRHQYTREQQQRVSSSTASTPSTNPRPPLTVSKTATVADTVVFQGHHAITIGAGTVIHPRAKLYSYSGPLSIGDMCIIGEKSTIGSLAPPSPSSSSSTSDGSPTAHKVVTTRISNAVIVAPLATILSGARVNSGAVIESLAVVNGGGSVGSHSKVCAGCVIPEHAAVDDWMVVWGLGGSYGQRRRKRAVERHAVLGRAAASSQQPQQPPEGKVVENARLVGLQKELQALERTLTVSLGGGGPRKR